MIPLKIEHDFILNIAVGKSREETNWQNKELHWSQLVKQLSRTTRTRETLEEYDALPKIQQLNIKDVGGFVGGTLKAGRRLATNVAWRQVITLDADYAGTDFMVNVSLKLPSYVIYSTHTHRPSNPRLRLVIPLSRSVTPDEYQAVARRLAADIDIDLFDDTTYQPHRLMFWPSSPSNVEYVFEYADGPPIDPDTVLARYPDWKDQSYWPVSSRAHKEIKKTAEKQGDPTEKKGVVGAFCRTYGITAAINTFLTEVYEACAAEDRYTFINGTSAAGLVVYEDKHAHSHHGTDPISGMTVNSFDLIRIHKFGELDENIKPSTAIPKRPSWKAMLDFATKDSAVKRTLSEERMAEAVEDFDTNEDNWLEKLDINNKGEIEDSLPNLTKILRYDVNLKGIAYNAQRKSLDIINEVPWFNDKTEGWSDNDSTALRGYIANTYKIYSPYKTKDAVINVARERVFHPLRDYLNGLPEWDGTPRIETLFVKYMGAEDSVYTRHVTRKTLCAAVTRVFRPGVKFDHLLVLCGKPGMGKSMLFSKLAGKWFSDSLSLADMKDKTAAEKLQGYWIIEIPEMVGIRKMDNETIKAFISRQDDIYRASYGIATERHPRECIIVGTSNNSEGFLRDITGNRRFWPINIREVEKNINEIEEQADQIWAEAMALFKAGELLYLSPEVEKLAEEKQLEALESDERMGLVQDYLDKKLPENWDDLDSYERRNFISDLKAEGTIQREYVSNMEIWCELFGRRKDEITKQETYNISAIMKKVKDWERQEKMQRIALYGMQRLYKRIKQI